MIGAGTIINPILKVVTTVAILAAVYFFIVKPSLETTEEISAGINESSQSIREGIQDSIRESQAQSGQQVDEALNQAQQALNEAGLGGGGKGNGVKSGGGAPLDLLECVQAANGDVTEMQACTQ